MSSARADDVLAGITNELDALFAMLGPVASGFARVAGLEQPAHEDLIDFRGAISDVISTPGLIGGAGVIIAPGLLVNAEYWMEWWWAVPDHDPEALRVNLEPSAPDFFDYTTADWYATPERTGTRHVAGPYVDYVCTNEYAMTLAQPVRAAGRFVGVAALDVPVAGFETRVLPALRALGSPATLANAAGRVIASTAAAVWPGQRVPAGEPSSNPSSFGWRIY
jgi:hypothetical protein